ncbi:hypothetical protein DCC79_13750 [bacterium]|nr:zf-HC2 domain-containing protein [Chloroflexi bacterium CFX6]RIL08477.1 MAG: hypothetical protein DCC79_13750 [bacterium]
MSNCIAPPALTTAALLAHLDGDADPETDAHVAQCGHCRANAAALAAQDLRLRTRLHRALCPPSDRLTAFHDRALAADAQADVARHVAECPRCRDELVVLDRFLRQPDPVLEPAGASPRARLKTWIVDLVSGPAGSAGRAAVGAGIRGGGSGGTWMYLHPESNIALSIQVRPDEDAAGDDRAVVSGRLVVPGMPDCSGLEAQLHAAGGAVARAPVSADGLFELHGIAPGRYDAVIVGPDGPIRTPGPFTV